MRMDKGMPFMDVPADFDDAPTFSEKVLYERLGKGDARFVLGVADEYEHVIKALGPSAVKAILDVNPRLVQRLDTGKVVADHLKDARDETELWHEDQSPSEVMLDRNAAGEVWQMLHNEYCRYYEPEKSMDHELLRAYNWLTDGIGRYAQDARQKERDRLPEKLKSKAEREAKSQKGREEKARQQQAHRAILDATNDKQRRAAIAAYKKAWGYGSKEEA